MTREQKYTQQLKELGIWQEAFAPEVHTLAIMERELQRMLKAWKAAGSPIMDETATGSPTSSKMLDAIAAMRRDILSHRDALGLTPKGLNRLRPKNGLGTESEKDEKAATVLELIRSRKAAEA